MQDIDIALLKHRSISGIVALTTRTFVLQIVSLIATFLLTIFLSATDFGIFYVITAIISFLAYFSDIGLAAALIQKKEELTSEDLKTTFTIQQILVTMIVCVSLLISAQIGMFYRLDNNGVWLLRSLILAFFLSSFKTIPSVLLERKLEFKKLVIPQIFETFCFYFIAVLLAWLGFGIVSFTIAVLARAVVGLVSMYIVSPWFPSIGFSKITAHRLIRFGLPFQLNSFLALLKDDLFTVFLGKILPFSYLGYIGWAKKWAEVPLRLIMDSVIRVTFPAFSRIQHDRQLLKNVLEKTIFGISLTVFPVTALLIFMIRPIVDIVPRYAKWEPALISFYIFAVSSAIASLSSPLTNALNAIGKIKITLFLMIVWTTLTWILSVIFIYGIGFNGYSLSLLVISFTIVLVVYLVRQETQFSFFQSIKFSLAGVIIQMLWYFLALYLNIRTFPVMVIWAFFGVILYSVTVGRFENKKIKEITKLFLTKYG